MTGHVLKLGDVVPNFVSDSTQGQIDFHSWLDGRLGKRNFHALFIFLIYIYNVYILVGAFSSPILLIILLYVQQSWEGFRPCIR